jgi:hypothetical protein
MVLWKLLWEPAPIPIDIYLIEPILEMCVLPHLLIWTKWIFKMCHSESSDTGQRRGQREEENRNNREIKSNLQHKEEKK